METRPHLVEPLSIDEAFLDLTGTQRALGDPIAVAKQSEDCIRWELGVTASVGVASCKFLAKLASDMNKLDELTVIREEDIDHVLPPLQMPQSLVIGSGDCGEAGTPGHPHVR